MYYAQVETPLAIIRVAAVTGSALKKLDEGMSKEDVLRLLGKPDGSQRRRRVRNTRQLRAMANSTDGYYIAGF